MNLAQNAKFMHNITHFVTAHPTPGPLAFSASLQGAEAAGRLQMHSNGSGQLMTILFGDPSLSYFGNPAATARLAPWRMQRRDVNGQAYFPRPDRSQDLADLCADGQPLTPGFSRGGISWASLDRRDCWGGRLYRLLQ